MNKQHTPGPWELWTSCSWRRFKTRDGNSVCEPTIAADGHPDLIINAKDAALIAAAPELLAALIKCVEQLEMISGKVHDERCALIDARAAIARATAS